MNLPNFPTDNLYKFIAVAGLMLAGYCAFFAYQQVWELRLQILRTETEEQVIDTDLKEINKELDSIIRRMDRKKEVSPNVLTELRGRGLAVVNQKTRIIGKKKENDLLIDQLNVHYRVFWSGIIGGLLISLAGFWLWYIRIQKPSETLMAKRIAEWEKDNMNSPM